MLRFVKVEDRTSKRHISIGVYVVYIDTGSSMPTSPSKLRDLADDNNKILTEWKWFETTILNVFGRKKTKGPKQESQPGIILTFWSLYVHVQNFWKSCSFYVNFSFGILPPSP